jgi:hypothetical protein
MFFLGLLKPCVKIWIFSIVDIFGEMITVPGMIFAWHGEIKCLGHEAKSKTLFLLKIASLINPAEKNITQKRKKTTSSAHPPPSLLDMP